MNKNIIITVLAITTICLGGYLVFDKVINNLKENSSVSDNNVNNNDVNNGNEERKDYEYVGSAFSGIKIWDWPTQKYEKENTDPSELFNKVDIPKILIKTSVTDKINSTIYNNYVDLINDVKSKESDSIFSFEIDYDYSIRNNVLFIIVTKTGGSSRAGRHTVYEGYYYDIKNDKELTVEEVCNIFDIKIDSVIEKDSSAEEIYAVMPHTTGFDVYYNQNSTCPSMGCQDMKTIYQY